jgi:hypothetical protein
MVNISNKCLNFSLQKHLNYFAVSEPEKFVESSSINLEFILFNRDIFACAIFILQKFDQDGQINIYVNAFKSQISHYKVRGKTCKLLHAF